MASHTCDTVRLTNLHVRLLTEVYDNSPAKVGLLIFDLQDTNVKNEAKIQICPQTDREV